MRFRKTGLSPLPPPPSSLILTVPRRYFCCGSLLLLVLAVRIYTLVHLLYEWHILVKLGSRMTTCLEKSYSFGLPHVLFVNCCQFMYLVISLLVLMAGYGIWLYQFLVIAYLFTFHYINTLKQNLGSTKTYERTSTDESLSSTAIVLISYQYWVKEIQKKKKKKKTYYVICYLNHISLQILLTSCLTARNFFLSKTDIMLGLTCPPDIRILFSCWKILPLNTHPHSLTCKKPQSKHKMSIKTSQLNRLYPSSI